MNRIPSRRQPLAVAAISLVVLLVVAGGVLLVGRLAPPPEPTASPPASLATASTDQSTPEGGVRAFFDAFARARRTDDPSLIRSVVTSEESAAYRSVEGFLAGQKEVHKASVLTVQRLEQLMVETTGEYATVRLVYTEGGYDISLDTGEPLESPTILPPRDVTVELRLIAGAWLVESYVAAPR